MHDVTLPRLSQGMETGAILRWLKSEGDRVEKGDVLYEIETDKATQEVEAEIAGVLVSILQPEGEHPVGTTIAYIGEPDERAPETPPAGSRRAPARRRPASPRARRIARERGVGLESVASAGPGLRLTAADVERAAALAAPARTVPPPPHPASAERVPLSPVRQANARRSTAAWEAPVFQLQVGIDMTRANAVVAALTALHPETRITYTDLFTKLCAVALVRHRRLNAHLVDEDVLMFPHANVSIPVATPSGVVMPVVHWADQLTVSEVATARGDLELRAEAETLEAFHLDGGTFTISNLGMYGIDASVAVLSPPQVAVLALGRVKSEVVADSAGGIEVRPMLNAALTCDHRAVDGAEGADFLRTVKALAEEPGLAL